MSIPLLGAIKANIINPLIWLMMAVALVYFLYGVYEFVAAAGSEEGRATGQRHVIYGVLGLAIMISVFGILNVICRTISCN